MERQPIRQKPSEAARRTIVVVDSDERARELLPLALSDGCRALSAEDAVVAVRAAMARGARAYLVKP